jgi:hypothetical protein
MIIKLTNASKDFRGHTLLINMDHIISIFSIELEDVFVTSLYSVSKEIWYVEENIDKVYDMINESEAK